MNTTRVYTYQELDQAQQGKVRDKIRQDLQEIAYLEPEVEMLQEQLEELGFSNVQISYDLSCCQGSGTSFTARISEADAAKLVKGKAGPEAEDNTITLRKNSYGNHYTHKHTVDVVTDDETDQSILDALDDWRLEKCEEMHTFLEEAYEGSYSDEAIDGWLEANEPKYVLSSIHGVVQL